MTVLWRLGAWIAGGSLIVWAIYRRQQYVAKWHAPKYREQIQALQSDQPLDLPAIRPLKARKIWRLHESKRRA